MKWKKKEQTVWILEVLHTSELLPQFEHIMQKTLFQMQISAGVFRRAFSSAQVSSREGKKTPGECREALHCLELLFLLWFLNPFLLNLPPTVSHGAF